MKRERRKPPPRKRPVRPALDDDMIELASVIAEHQLEQNAKGWFTVPWRSGWNAARLARVLWGLEEPGALVSTAPIDRIFTYERLDGEIYEQLEDLQMRWAATSSNTRTLRAAARILQIMFARSDGGGHVYNDVLRALFENVVSDPANVVHFVRAFRRRDALGWSYIHPAVPHQRLARAFDIAWDRGLFHAAYAINPITKE